MGVKKQVLILANSVKCGCRCIAGLEIVEQNGVKRVGDWIRPVGAGKDGGVTAVESRLHNLGQPAVLDVVEIEVERPQGSACQPENWALTPGAVWRKLDARYSFDDLNAFVEYPGSLWGTGDGGRSDRVPESEVPDGFGPFQSLYLIRPQNVEFSMTTATDYESGYTKKKRRVSFCYNGATYNLPVTDPTIGERRFTSSPLKNMFSQFVPEAPDKWLMVVSLARPFNGYHYKIGATILENRS